MKNRVFHNPLDGRFTTVRRSYEDAEPQNGRSCSENNATNAWNVRASDGNLNNNNNKSSSYRCRAVAATDGFSEFLGSVREAYRDCLRGKRRSAQAVEYMQYANDDIPVLAREMWSGIYHQGTSTCFLIRYPKLREVFAAGFRDRIVHHWICLRLEPLFEDRFKKHGDVTFNCRKGYGTDKCVRHLAEGSRKVSSNYTKEAWLFKGDISGFFMSIDKILLMNMLDRFIRRWKARYEREGWSRIGKAMPVMYWDILMRLTRIVVLHHPENDCVFNTPVNAWKDLAANKSLFNNGEKGEPIGNLTTQLFANFYMSYFDEYVIHLFRGRNFAYDRFVDDWVVQCDDKRFLLDSIQRQEFFLDWALHLRMHPNKRYVQPVSHGVQFIGAYIKPNRIYLSNRTLARFMERAVGFARLMGKKPLTPIDCFRIEQVINSYLGFCKDKHTYNKRKEIVSRMGMKMYKYFYVRGHYSSIRTKREYRMLNIN